ncbi:SDR family oxidoreductase [soil metagenome]
MADVLIVGCGYLGRVAAKRWISQGNSVAALTRSKSAELATHGITTVNGNVLDQVSLKALPATKTVLYAVGMDRTAGHSMREVYVEGLKNVLTALPATNRLIYVSSTGVYGQAAGEWVDETAPSVPLEASGQVVLEAETLLKSIRPDAIILRFAGIYGPNRLLRKKPLLAGEPFVGDAEKWLNLIHVGDGADAILAAESSGISGQTYNVSDGTPVTRRDFYTYLAELLHAHAAKFEPPATPQTEPNRRVSNRKAREQLSFVPMYSSFREGLAAALAASDS